MASSVCNNFQFYISTILGFLLWKISPTENGKFQIVLSKWGVSMSILMFVVLTISSYHDYHDSTDLKLSDGHFVIDIAMMIIYNFTTVLPYVVLVSVWIHVFTYKRLLEKVLRVRQFLIKSGVNVDALPWLFQAATFGIIVAYVTKIGMNMNSFSDVEMLLLGKTSTEFNYGTFIWWTLFDIFIFATLYKFIYDVMNISVLFNMANEELKKLCVYSSTPKEIA